MRKKGAINSVTEDAKSVYADYLKFLEMPVITESGKAPLFEAVDTVTVSLTAQNEKDAEGLGKLLFWTVPESYLFDTLAQRLPKNGTAGLWAELDELRKRYQNAESLSDWSDIPDIYLQIASRTGMVPSLPQGAEFGPHGGFDACTIRGSYELLLPGKLMKAVCRIAGLKDPTDDHTLTSAEASFAIFYRKMRALVRGITVADADPYYIPENSLEKRTLQLHSKFLESAVFEFHDVAITSTGSVYVDGVAAFKGRVGWWSHTEEKLPNGESFADSAAVPGDRTLRIVLADDETKPLRDFFTFRKPQPDYFQGPTQPKMWSWLEVYPQHRFTSSAGVNEQMSVGVGQNAVNGRLGSMSEPGARGRSFHDGRTDHRPDAVRHGFNVSEQWEHALREDPRFIFVTGWNEWIAGRFAEFNGVKLPVMFVDQFDQEQSRDIEPMRGGHGDDYYWQLVSYIRRYKGARELPSVVPQSIQIDGKFEDWREVQPEFRDTIGDPVRREHRGWKITYQNQTGRNDFVAAKMSWDQERAYFYVRTADPITEADGTNWMNLLLDIDTDNATGWLGYDFIVNFQERGSLERNAGEFHWKEVGGSEVQLKSHGSEMQLSIPWRALGQSRPAKLDFKWTDNCFQSGDWIDLTLNGDAAPNDRFNYRAILSK